jgi:riboflavin kinase / FMN adenylyltransferase
MNKEDTKNQTKMIIQGDMQTFFTIHHSYYTLTGIVVEGNKIGHTIGFPTANILPDSGHIVPSNGVYAVFVSMDGKILKGMLNIGIRPTFDLHQVTIEVHLLDFSEMIYNRQITVYFVDRIRDEIKFETKELLVEQLNSDRKAIRNLLEKAPLPNL